MNARKIFNLRTAVLLAMPLFLAACGGSDKDDQANVVSQPTTYTFPLTLAGQTGESSVSYSGQMARHALRNSLKSYISGDSFTKYEAMKYYANADKVIDGSSILSPSSKGAYVFKEAVYSDISSGKNLSGKSYDVTGSGDPIPGGNAQGKVMGFPGNLSPNEFVEWMLERRETAGSNIDPQTGYEYNQLVAKYLMGSVFYNQTVDKYLDENLAAGTKPNNEPYGEGKPYTGKEHSWDEGFGYFGAAAHYGDMTATQNYEVSKQGKSLTQEEALALADKDGDGVVSMYTEYNYAAAYYAASFDKGGNSTYGADIVNAFLAGRTVIANAVDSDGVARVLTDDERTSLKGYASTIQSHWEKVFAEAIYKYAGSVDGDITELVSGTETNPKSYYHHWGELKGFMLALQYGGANSTIDAAMFTEIDNLIGYGPVLPNGNQVNGLTTSGAPTFSTGNSMESYKANMKQIQQKLDALYGLKTKLNAL